eukprot:2287098-Lingulodinium_polyedra.AAC.1
MCQNHASSAAFVFAWNSFANGNASAAIPRTLTPHRLQWVRVAVGTLERNSWNVCNFALGAVFLVSCPETTPSGSSSDSTSASNSSPYETS